MSILKLIEMKTLFKYLGAVAIIAMVGVNCYVASDEILSDLSLNSLVGLQDVTAESANKDDEKEVNLTNFCNDGTTCTMVVCIKGGTDCSPDEDCCQESNEV